MVAGGLSPCALPGSAWAGDKIEFSAPSASLEVPQVVHEDTSPLSFHMPRQADYMTPEGMQRPPPMVIISTSRGNGLKAWDSDDTDDQDDVYSVDRRDNLDRRTDSSYSKQQAVDGATKKWYDPRDPELKSVFSERRRDEAANGDHLRGRLNSENAPGKNDYGADQLYGRHFGDLDEDWSRRTQDRGLQSEGSAKEDLSAWAHSVLHPASYGIDRTLAKQQRFTQMGTVNPNNRQRDSSEDSSGVSDRLPTNPGLPAGAESVARQWSQWGDRDRRTPEETSREPLHYRDEYTNTMGQYSDSFSRPQPLAVPPSQVQSPPAILPFPKKPGSVF